MHAHLLSISIGKIIADAADIYIYTYRCCWCALGDDVAYDAVYSKFVTHASYVLFRDSYGLVRVSL